MAVVASLSSTFSCEPARPSSISRQPAAEFWFSLSNHGGWGDMPPTAPGRCHLNDNLPKVLNRRIVLLDRVPASSLFVQSIDRRKGCKLPSRPRLPRIFPSCLTLHGSARDEYQTSPISILHWWKRRGKTENFTVKGEEMSSKHGCV
jgi:hypothetical protein